MLFNFRNPLLTAKIWRDMSNERLEQIFADHKIMYIFSCRDLLPQYIEFIHPPSVARGVEVLNLHGHHSGTRIRGSRMPSVCPSVRLLLIELVPAPWPDRAKTFKV